MADTTNWGVVDLSIAGVCRRFFGDHARISALMLAATIGGWLVLTGCASSPQSTGNIPAHGPVLLGQEQTTTKHEAPAEETDTAFDEIANAYEQLGQQQHGSILGSASDQRARERANRSQLPMANVSRGYAVDPIVTDEAAAESPAANSQILAIEERSGVVVGDPDPNQRSRERVRLTNELARILTTDAGDPRQATQALLTLAALELVEPGVLNSHFGDLANAGITSLPSRDRQVVMAWRDFFRDAHVELNKTGDPASLAELADALTLALDGVRSLTIPSATLCTKVEGFGVYTPLTSDAGTYRLLAGRRHKVIVYTEMKHFTTSPTGKGDGYEVALSQDLLLYHYAEATDTLAWQRTGDEIRDVSRNRRQDFFTAQIIDLPETLSVGTYRLKVIVRDRKGGGVAERIIPIEIVAHASALGSR